jgi:hypothetical protein
MNYVEWLKLNQQRCSEGRHSYRTARRVSVVLVYERFPVRLRVRKSMRCWVCPFRLYEPLDVSAAERSVRQELAMRRAMS